MPATDGPLGRKWADHSTHLAFGSSMQLCSASTKDAGRMVEEAIVLVALPICSIEATSVARLPEKGSLDFGREKCA